MHDVANRVGTFSLCYSVDMAISVLRHCSRMRIVIYAPDVLCKKPLCFFVLALVISVLQVQDYEKVMKELSAALVKAQIETLLDTECDRKTNCRANELSVVKSIQRSQSAVRVVHTCIISCVTNFILPCSLKTRMILDL